LCELESHLLYFGCRFGGGSCGCKKNKDPGKCPYFCFGFWGMGYGFIIEHIIRKGVLGIFLGFGIGEIVGREVGCNRGSRRFGGRVRL